MASIAIVGAGMAGLTALQALKQQGHHVTVFDKSRGSGGRLASKKVGNASWDMGAQFMRSHTDAFAQQLQQWQQQGWIEPWPVAPWVIDSAGARPSPDEVERFVSVSRMTALSRQLVACADEFATSTRIVHCRLDQQQWYLHDDEQQCHGPFDALIVNLPPAQAQPLLGDSPELQQQCQVEMLPCWTLLLAFEQPLDTAIDAAFVKHGAIGWLARNNSKPQRDAHETWVIQANHHWSQQRLEHPREQVQQELITAFAQALQLQIPHATEQWLHRWLYAIAAEPLQRGALSDPQRRLSVCGDWCHSGAVEGAWLSGRQAGNDINTFLE
jgi:predicted NAD/FAD-dependent oxidoreductase